MKYYKTLMQNGESPFQYHSWQLPKKDEEPGDWMPQISGALLECRNGYHICAQEQLIFWLSDRIFLAEPRGQIEEGRNKVICGQVRLLRELNWNRYVARKYISECLEFILGGARGMLGDGETVPKGIEVLRRIELGRSYGSYYKEFEEVRCDLHKYLDNYHWPSWQKAMVIAMLILFENRDCLCQPRVLSDCIRSILEAARGYFGPEDRRVLLLKGFMTGRLMLHLNGEKL